MGDASAVPLLSGTRFIPGALSVGESLPKDTFLSGRLVLLFPFSPAHPVQLRFRLAAKFSAAIAPNDYVAATPSRRIKWTFNITISPNDEVRRSWANEKESLEGEHARLGGLMGKEVDVACDGLVVSEVSGTNVHLEAAGSRMMATEGMEPWTVFQVATQSTAPSWLETPSLPSPTGSPVPPAPADRPSGFKPITSLAPPKFNIAPLQVEKRKVPESDDASNKGKDASRPVKRVHIGGGSTTRDPVFVHPHPIRPSRQSVTRGSSSLPKVGSLESLIDEPPSIIQAAVREETAQTRDNDNIPAPSKQPDQADPSRLLSNPKQTPSTAKPDVAAGPSSPAQVGHASHSNPPDFGVDIAPMANATTSRERAEAAARNEAVRAQAAQQAQADEQLAQIDRLRKPLDLDRVRYTPLQDVKSGIVANLIGIVIKVEQIKKGPVDYLVSLVISDPTTHTGDETAEDMVITIFRPRPEQLPTTAIVGCPILFRHLVTNKWNDKVKGNAYSRDPNCWVYMVGDTQPKFSDPRALNPPLVPAELQRLSELKQWWNGDAARAASVTQIDGAPRGEDSVRATSRNSSELGANPEKAKCLGDVQFNQFYDVVVRIIHVNPARNVHFELYVVDGTLSPLPLRNYHNIAHPHLPPAGVFKLDIQRRPPPAHEPYFQPGNVLLLRNVRCKQYRGELEMIWSEKMTEEQEERGYKPKIPILIPASDERAKLIERRIASFKHGRRGESVAPKVEEAVTPLSAPLPRPASISQPLNAVAKVAPVPPTNNATARVPIVSAEPAPTLPAPPPQPSDIPLASHVYTTLTDTVEHPTQTISQILTNRTFPNKFRVKARVLSVFSRGLKGNDSFVQKHCSHCRRAIVKQAHCLSCNDVKMVNASWRYSFIATLEDEGGSIPIIISDDEANRFLPPLPPPSASTNPNDIKKTNRQIAETKKGVLDVLQGAPMDGIRPVPYIDWTLQSYIVPLPKGHTSSKGEKGVMVHRAFGMEAR